MRDTNTHTIQREWPGLNARCIGSKVTALAAASSIRALVVLQGHVLSEQAATLSLILLLLLPLQVPTTTRRLQVVQGLQQGEWG